MTTRRRVLTILAGAATLPILGTKAALSNVNNWRGIALGAQAQIILDHPQAENLIAGAVQEIRRLEGIFSLYLPDSELSKLNRDGVLLQPSFEMVELLSLCASLNGQTNGAFDPTVQSLWALYAQSYSQGTAPTQQQIAQANLTTGWQNVQISTSEISFAKRGVMLTLNGVAQGFIADKITSYFRANGVHNVLVNAGEISAIGLSPAGDAWQVHLGKADGRAVFLNNSSIATSAPLGTVFDRDGKVGHIIDPRTGYPAGMWSEVSVITDSAAKADALSTGFSLMSQNDIDLVSQNMQVYLTK